MQIAGYLKTSFIEWPGKIAAVIFTQGCNFRCPFCHNRDLVEPGAFKKASLIREETIWADLKERKEWIDGVAVTGGEPTLQPDLAKFFKKIKKMGFVVMLESNGSNPEILEKLIKKKEIDFLAMDYKTTFKDYLKVVRPEKNASGVSKDFPTSSRLGRGRVTSEVTNAVKKSMRLVLESGLDYEFRTTVVPTIHDKNMLVKMAKELKRFFRNNKIKIRECNWVLQAFRPQNCLDPEFDKIASYNQDQMKDFLVEVKKIIPAKLR